MPDKIGVYRRDGDSWPLAETVAVDAEGRFEHPVTIDDNTRLGAVVGSAFMLFMVQGTVDHITV